MGRRSSLRRMRSSSPFEWGRRAVDDPLRKGQAATNAPPIVNAVLLAVVAVMAMVGAVATTDLVPAIGTALVVVGCAAVGMAGMAALPVRWSRVFSVGATVMAYLAAGLVVGVSPLGGGAPVYLAVLFWPYLLFAIYVACPLGACPFGV